MTAPSPFAEVFVSTHAEALKRASDLDSGSSADVDGEALRIPGVSDYEIEQLGGLVGAAVHAAGADYELSMVDVASDTLLAVPPAMVRALAELLAYESEDWEVCEDEVTRSMLSQTPPTLETLSSAACTTAPGVRLDVSHVWPAPLSSSPCP